MLRCLDDAALERTLSSGSFLYVGAISFEQRATAWASRLARRFALPRRAVIFDYDTEADPAADDRALRQASEQIFLQELAGVDVAIPRRTNAFAANVLEATMRDEMLDPSLTACLIDITCLTRVHLFAAAGAAIAAREAGKQVIYCYASALGYGFSKKDFHGWRDVLFVSISRAPFADSNARSYGIVSAGHDGERLSVALQELEPPSGVMIYAANKSRPDFISRALSANAVTHERLETLRSPRQNHGVKIDDRWSFENIEVDDFESLNRCVQRQLAFASSAAGSLAIYPFGPKPMTLRIADAMKRTAEISAWMVYPIPHRFSVNYSSGVGSLSAYLST